MGPKTLDLGRRNFALLLLSFYDLFLAEFAFFFFDLEELHVTGAYPTLVSLNNFVFRITLF